MARPRIIIADTDVNYILSLQLKFVEEFFEKIDLEIITDRNYFENMFESPQRAEVLIVSEDLYDLSIQKHNIGNVFLMTEKNEEEQTADLNVTIIFKYTSIKEIFNEILGKTSDSLNVKNSGKKDPQIVVVTSASGGVGKTTLAMGISACLSQNYKKVLYVNCSRLQSFGHLLKNSSPVSDSEIYSKLSRNNKGLYHEVKHMIRQELFSYLPPLKASLVSLGVPMEVFLNIAQEAKKSREFDFIIMDTDAYFDENKAEQLTIADKVIIVTRQTKASVFSTNILVKNVNGISNEKYLFLCNDFNSNKDNILISSEMELKFTINEYIEHIENYDAMLGVDFAEQTSMKKLAYLLD